jgi:integrase
MGVAWCAMERRRSMRTSKKSPLPGITSLGNGRYLIRVERKDPRTGKPVDVMRRVECNAIEEAVAEKARMQREIALGVGPKERVQLRTYAVSWLTGRLPTLKPSTRARYARDLDAHVLPALGDYYLDALAAEDVLAWFKALAESYAAATANGCLRLLKTVMADATVQHGLRCDPTARVRAVPDVRADELDSDEPVNLLSATEMGTFLGTLKERWPQWYALVFTQFATAARFGEVSALRWEDIDEQRAVVKIRRAQWRGIVSTTKTGRIKTVPLTDELRDVLREWRQEMVRRQHRHVGSGWLFPSRAGHPHHNASCMRKAFIDCLHLMGLERRFSSHGLRRTANDLLRRIATGEVTRAITGHMTEAMTEHYSHVDATEKREAAEGMLRLVMTADGAPE